MGINEIKQSLAIGCGQQELWGPPLETLYKQCLGAAGSNPMQPQTDQVFELKITWARDQYCDANYLKQNKLTKERCFASLLAYPDDPNVQQFLGGKTLTQKISEVCSGPLPPPSPRGTSSLTLQQMETQLKESLIQHPPKVTIVMPQQQWNLWIALLTNPEALSQITNDVGQLLSEEEKQKVLKIVIRIDSLMQKKHFVTAGDMLKEGWPFYYQFFIGFASLYQNGDSLTLKIE